MRVHLAFFLAALLLPLVTQAQAVEEVPFITTPDNVTLAMLQLAGVRRGDHVIDLGSGDGRIVITAARRFGASGLGVEIVPDLVERSRESARKAGVQQRVEFRVQDLFKTDLSRASVITMYLLPEVNLQLRPLLLQLAPGTRIVSHDWDMGDWLPDQTLTVAAPDKTIGREKVSRLRRWVVPARAEGLWCGAGGVQLRLTQRYQAVQGQWRQGDREWALHGALQGPLLQLVGEGTADPVSAVAGTPARGRAGPASPQPGTLQGRLDDGRMVLQCRDLALRGPVELHRTTAGACSG